MNGSVDLRVSGREPPAEVYTAQVETFSPRQGGRLAFATEALGQGPEKAPRGRSLASFKLDWLDQVSSDDEVADAAFRVGYIIAQHVNDKTRVAWPKIETISKLLNKCERSVRASVHSLSGRKHIRCSKRGSGNLNQYELLLNDLSVEDRSRASSVAAEIRRITSRVSALSNSKSRSTFSSQFERFMEAFPHKPDGHDLSAARYVYGLNLQYGTTADEMLAGAKAYAKFCSLRGYTGTSRVYEAEDWLDISAWRTIDPDGIPLDERSGL
ncbi:helix-turn-helix domain-containing protein [Methylobacterium sp. CM6244]